MTSQLIFGGQLHGLDVYVYPSTDVGPEPVAAMSYGVQRLATDPVGSAVVTFAGVAANSEIRVYLPDGTEAAGVENCVANQQLTWNAYAVGSANNTVTIRIVHPSYRIKEFEYPTTLGAQTIPIQMEVDKWYSNPA